jgi:alkyl sulfatase BDS1-like metallo-beta-lactamase superfamily hydrolase
MSVSPKDATTAIRNQHVAVRSALPFDDDRDVAAADRGLLGAFAPGVAPVVPGDTSVDRRRP